MILPLSGVWNPTFRNIFRLCWLMTMYAITVRLNEQNPLCNVQLYHNIENCCLQCHCFHQCSLQSAASSLLLCIFVVSFARIVDIVRVCICICVWRQGGQDTIIITTCNCRVYWLPISVLGEAGHVHHCSRVWLRVCTAYARCRVINVCSLCFVGLLYVSQTNLITGNLQIKPTLWIISYMVYEHYHICT